MISAGTAGARRSIAPAVWRADAGNRPPRQLGGAGSAAPIHQGIQWTAVKVPGRWHLAPRPVLSACQGRPLERRTGAVGQAAWHAAHPAPDHRGRSASSCRWRPAPRAWSTVRIARKPDPTGQTAIAGTDETLHLTDDGRLEGAAEQVASLQADADNRRSPPRAKPSAEIAKLRPA